MQGVSIFRSLIAPTKKKKKKKKRKKETKRKKERKRYIDKKIKEKPPITIFIFQYSDRAPVKN